MKTTTTWTKRTLALVLALAIVLGIAACGAKPAQQDTAAQSQAQVQLQTGSSAEQEYTREDKELIAELIGGVESPSDLTDQELDALVGTLTAQKSEQPYTQEEKKLIVELTGSTKNPDDLTDKELDVLIEELTQNLAQGTASGVVNLGNTENAPTVDTSKTDSVYDDNGAMTKPFDQVYPELIEQEEVTFSGESILVKLKNDTLTEGLKAAGIGALEAIVPMEGAAWYEAKLIEGVEAEEALAAVRELKEVLLAEYNYEIQTAALDHYKDYGDKHKDKFDGNDRHKDQWHFHHTGIPDAYEEMDKDGGDPSVIVAVIDSGVDYDHEDLIDNMWVNEKEIPDNGIDDDGNGYVDDYYGVDIVSRQGNGDDTNGHGTHVAGIIASRNNNIGVMGIAYNVKIMSVKAAMHNGTLNQADIARAVLYAYEMGAEVINMSFGGTACSIAVQDALATAYTRCVLVASAGNNGAPNEGIFAMPNYPAALTYVLGVMSVDETGRESAFTNYDVFAFNGIEYELYAPGEGILSTLPNNQYGYLSGTSMAAPIVSSMAAILRSEFSDRDKYPTKFIYGQLASTSEYHAECLNPELHGNHNLPQIVDLNAALTKLPKPEVNYQEYYLFDDPAFSEKNNGDGVIDAGETIALGMILRNRWGMSENTLVTIDTISAISGLSDPYITIENPTVNYGSVGTYSTQDCGRIYTDEIITGWENPFYITISEDCPNDYRFTLNVTIQCENALDEADETIYTSTATVNENVRAGYILPSVIEEDMVLTPENLYIIPKATIIREGVTVRVEPGTHIQFWSDDPNDPYADTYMAYLVVSGKFLVEGTRENPVYIYPSELMGNYIVDMGTSGDGYISLEWADVTQYHPRNATKITRADHCTFRSNYQTVYYRYLNGGNVRTSSTYLCPSVEKATNCVFYKIYTSSSLYGNYDRCIFSQCAISYGTSSDGSYSYTNCVFLGNSYVNQTNPNSIYNSSMTRYNLRLPNTQDIKENDFDIIYRPETGTTYVRWYDHGYEGCATAYAKYLEEAFGGSSIKIETEDERAWLANYFYNHYGHFRANVTWDGKNSCYLWSDGTPVDLNLFPEAAKKLGTTDYYVSFDPYKGVLEYDHTNYCLFEIPGEIKPTDITFQEYAVDMDVDTTYQIAPMNTPTQLPATDFIYESTDEAVLTVSETGLVTPVANGIADVWVWSLDKAIRNRITFTVREYVALESIAFPAESLKLEMGTSAYAPCVLTPADTTRHNVTYVSSDPSVVKVENGLLTAVGKGTATITATCEGLSTSLNVTTWVRATSLTYETYYNYVTVESCDTALPTLKVSPANADLDLEWFSGDESILSVENGELQLKKAGETYLRFTDRNSGLSDSVRYVVTSTAPVIDDDVIAVQLGAEPMDLPAVTLADGAAAEPVWKILDPAVATLKDGKIFFNNPGFTTLRVTDPRSGLKDEIFIYVTEEETPKVKELLAYQSGYYNSYQLAVMEDGRVYYWFTNPDSLSIGNAPTLVHENAKVVGTPTSYYTIISQDNVALPYNQGSLIEKNGSYAVQHLTLPEYIDPVGAVGYFYTYTSYGSLNRTGSLWVLSEDGKVYAIGNNSYGALGIGTTENALELTQVRLNEKVVKIAGSDSLMYYLTENGNLYISGGSTMQAATPVMVSRNVTWLDDSGTYYVANDRLYKFNGDKSEEQTGYDLTGWTMLDMNDNGNFSGIIAKGGKVYDLYASHINCTNLEDQLKTENLSSVKDAISFSYGNYTVTEEGLLFGRGYTHSLMGMSKTYSRYDGRETFLPLDRPAQTLEVVETNLTGDILTEDSLKLYFNKQLLKEKITIAENGTTMIVNKTVNDECVELTPAVGLASGNVYTVTISAADTMGFGHTTAPTDITISFLYEAPDAPEVEETVPEIPAETEETLPDIEPAEKVVYEAILDESVWRYWTAQELVDAMDAFIAETQYDPTFNNNAILNPISTDFEVSHWLRFQANTITLGTYGETPLGGNYWGTTNEKAIGLQLIDFEDFPNYAKLQYAPFLTEAPEDTFPFVTSVKLFNKDGEEVTTVGNEQVRFQVKFNRDMDTSIPLLVRYGSAYPYGDYEIDGKYIDARTWEGTYTLNTLIENGYQYFTISNGWSAEGDLQLQTDQYRFLFEIDTTAAQALIMQGNPTDTGIELKWTQDDFDTLMGYNVYRSDDLNGYYQRLNSTVIPADTMEWFDDTVEPGKVYYYNFTVVQTDMSESEPSGKISLMSKDTMAPNIYHSPIYTATTGQNLIISADVTDNLNIMYANLYYRVVGTDTWKTIRMNALNDKYSAILPAGELSLDGMEYYIEAFDGVSYTYRGSESEPFTITVREALDKNSLGDVDGDGTVTNRDALILLQAISHKYNMTSEEFQRADLNGDNVLSAVEALRILHYVTGKVGSLVMDSE